MNATTKFVCACPKGHRGGLRLRVVADVPFDCEPVNGLIEPDLSHARLIDVQEPGSNTGVDSGVFCPTCEEWYAAVECVHPADDAGNPEVPDLGCYEVRHDINGFYVCTLEEAEQEDADDGLSCGHDGREHFATEEAATAHAAKLASA